MARLEEITVGSTVVGIIHSSPVEVVGIKWFGDAALEVTFKKPSGDTGNQLIYRDDEASLEIKDKALRWSFKSDSEQMRLTSEAYRMRLAHLFDPYLAVHTSPVEPLPHQISAVYEAMLPKQPLRYVLADDPGAGKTIMTGLLLKELIIRGDVKRCLIVAPGSLVEQWQDEMLQKFHLRFDILTNDRIESAASGNVFTEINFCIARLDKLSRNEDVQNKLRRSEWDLIVCDEAHKMSASFNGENTKYTKRFQLGQLLSNITRHFLLLTATPHNGKEEDFQLFMSLIDKDRFESAGKGHINKGSTDVSDIMRRLVKEDLLRFDGTPLFPERIAYTLNYDLSPKEALLYDDVTHYVQEEFNRADKLQNNKRKTTVGFALTILQRRLASSPEAIYQSLLRRRKRLEDRLEEEKAGKRTQPYVVDELKQSDRDDDKDDYLDELSAEELETFEDTVSDQASAASTVEEMEAEIAILKQLETQANKVRMSGEDRKWDELSKLLQDNEKMFDKSKRREKIIIFTEHRDTLNYLSGKISSLLGGPETIVTIHGGMQRDRRREAQTLFKEDARVRVMIATDAAGEGINLQRAHLMINYDLPWNPNRLEQRFGRIHRIGQTEACFLWNLVSDKTREGQVFQRLFAKLEQERKALGGKVFDILGKVRFDNKPLRELLIEAIRYGSDPARRARLNTVVDNSLNRKALEKLLQENALTSDTMDIHRVIAIREEMERMEAHKLQPYFIERFFVKAFTGLRGQIRRRESGRYEITYVPSAIRNKNAAEGFGEAVTQRYERVCFDKEHQNVPGQKPATLIYPGHPLMKAVIDIILEQNAELMKQGAVFIDEGDMSDAPRILAYIESSIHDGTTLPDGSSRIISRRLHFVELDEHGCAKNAGYAPYLDYRAPNEEEFKAVMDYLPSQQWLTHEVEQAAMNYAVSSIIPGHFNSVKKQRTEAVNKIQKAVKERLTAVIQYYDYRAAELKQCEDSGKVNSDLNSDNMKRRAEELTDRMEKRLKELEDEKQILPKPPVIAGGALVVPRGLLNRLMGVPQPEMFSLEGRDAVERAAMNAVIAIERRKGFIPKDVSAENAGYDIESKIPDEKAKGGSTLRFIEVKGRKAGAGTVTVTANEILTALNKPDEYILAIVEVDGDKTAATYIRRPFAGDPDPSMCSANYEIDALRRQGHIEIDREVQHNA
ncbi:MAG TPA: DUF3883 domain-containing protein [Candidatus Caccocola faecigallinarum]|nr:DUF3883 domain-containing protein [Candidatus Caccocola faecigallinarum]